MVKNYFLTLAFLSCACYGQLVNIPDANFKNALVNTLCVDTNGDLMPDSDADVNNDGEIDLAEAAAVTVLNVYNQSISSLSGIAAFSSLNHFTCSWNNISVLDVSMLPQLQVLNCEYNQISNLMLNTFDGDWCVLVCGHNQLTSLVLPSATYDYVSCEDNQLTSIDFSQTSMIYESTFANNQISTFTLPQENDFSYLNLSGNPLTEFDLIGPHYFEYLYFNDTQLQYLDLGNVESVNYLMINSNPYLQAINLRNGNFDGFDNLLQISDNPMLTLVCVDDNTYTINEGGDIFTITEIGPVTAAVNDPDVSISFYCSLSPAGEYNTIEGSAKLNCGTDDIALPNLRIEVETGFGDQSVFTNSSGEFTSHMGTGNVTVTPDFENAYFNVSPANYIFDFADYNNTTEADFCIWPNGVHPDLEVTIFSNMPPRPGFDVSYAVILKNKGTETQSGNLSFEFDDAVLDVVSANPAVSVQAAGVSNWNFTDLHPFEVRYFAITLNLNSPTETPAVNIGDSLSMTAQTSADGDQTPMDNSMTITQTVVGSYDPNDKTVIEGSSISITQLDGYLHYLVRFQNTGTYAAENVVIRDMLSGNLQPGTLDILSASHPVRTTLTQQNKLEFFFEGINLPAETDDEPASHGYVLFKIKPISTLEAGAEIENTAEIFFDYNFPIVTNTVTTTIVPQLNVEDLSQNAASIHPNPVTSEFTISTQNGALIDSVAIYNSLGQLVKLVRTPENTVGINELSPGTYFVEIAIDGKKIVKKLIKI